MVILALNIENAISDAGYDTVIKQQWKVAYPMLRDFYEVVTSGWILYPTLMLTGATFYEWISYAISRLESDGSDFQRLLIVWNAETIAGAFSKKGMNRRLLKPDRDLVRFNARLKQFNMPLIPMEFSSDEEINRAYSSYLMLLARDQFDHALQFISNISLNEANEPQSPEGTEPKTQQ